MKVRVLVNPRAGGGAAGRRGVKVMRALAAAGASGDWVETAGPGNATALARRARDDGVACLAVMGGDGTLNEVVQAYVDAEGLTVDGPELALLPCGTGGDFRRTFDLSTRLDAAVDRLLDTPARPVDLGWLRFVSNHGAPTARAFVNVASFGIGGLTDRMVTASPKWWGGGPAFYVGTLRAMVSYRNLPVSVEVDGQIVCEAPIFNAALANGRYFGGGMLIAPDADPTDGRFEVVVMHDLSRARALSLSRKIYRGTHIGTQGVLAARGSHVAARPLCTNDEVLIDLDGETPGRLPLEAHVLPGALRMRV